MFEEKTVAKDTKSTKRSVAIELEEPKTEEVEAIGSISTVNCLAYGKFVRSDSRYSDNDDDYV